MTTIQIRIDEKTKRSAKRIFDELGIDMSTGIKAFLKQVVQRKGIPFRLVTENGLTLKEELAILKVSKDVAQGKNVSGPYTDINDLIADLNK